MAHQNNGEAFRIGADSCFVRATLQFFQALYLLDKAEVVTNLLIEDYADMCEAAAAKRRAISEELYEAAERGFAKAHGYRAEGHWELSRAERFQARAQFYQTISEEPYSEDEEEGEVLEVGGSTASSIHIDESYKHEKLATEQDIMCYHRLKNAELRYEEANKYFDLHHYHVKEYRVKGILSHDCCRASLIERGYDCACIVLKRSGPANDPEATRDSSSEDGDSP